LDPERDVPPIRKKNSTEMKDLKGKEKEKVGNMVSKNAVREKNNNGVM